MKKTNIAKRIVSIVLAMSIVLSFALVSVSAAEANPAANAEPKGIVSKGTSNIRSFEWDNGVIKGITVAGATTAIETTTVAKGTYSMALTPSDDTLLISNYSVGNGAGFAINTNDYKPAGTQFFDLAAATSVNNYFTMFAYAEEAGVNISVYDAYGTKRGQTVTLEAGVWTAYDCMVGKPGSNVLIIAVENASGKKVYFDNVKVQQITAVADAELTQDSFEFDYETQNTATVEYTSTVDLASTTTVTATNDATADAIVAGDKLTVNLSNVALGETYDLTITVKDAFGRTTEIPKSVTMPSALPISIVGSSISGVVSAPVGVVYVDAEEAINPATLGGIAVVGAGATVTGATLKDDDTIRVELSGVLPAESYTITFDGVESVNGGSLNDTLVFSTKADNVSYTQNFEGIEANPETGVKPVPSGFTSVVGCPRSVSNEQARGDSGDSLKVTSSTNTYYGNYSAVWIPGTTKGKTYKVSFWFYSDTWDSAKNNGDPLVGADYATVSVAPVFSSHEKGQWNKVTFVATPTSESYYNAVMLQIRDLGGVAGESCVYIDDIEIYEIGTVGQPIMVNNGRYVSELSLGTTTVEIPVTNANAKAYIVSYDAQGRMLAFDDATVSNGAINLTWTATTPAYETKIIVMDATTFAPLCDAFVY